MSDFNEIVKAAVSRDNLWLRGAVQEFVRLRPRLVDIAKPEVESTLEIVVAAGIMELLAMRLNQEAPSWTGEIGGLSEPFYLATVAERMPFTRRLCEEESPEPLRNRNLLAPPQFLTWA